LSSTDDGAVTPSDDDATPADDATTEQVEATTEAAAAEGHAESTEAGTTEAADAETAPTDAAPEPEPEPEPVDPTSPTSTDELRLGLLQVFKDELGDAVVGAHIRDGDDLWIRVTPEAWRDAAALLKGKLGCTSFCFLSAIDWMPSPFGRSEDDPTEPAPVRDTAVKQGYAGGDARFQVFARVTSIGKHFGVTIKAAPTGTSASVTRCSASASTATPTCATCTCRSTSKGIRCARTSRCWRAW